MDTKYTMTRKPRYWDYIACMEVDKPNKFTYTFDSTFEYNIYKSLKERFRETDIIIQPHPYFVSGSLRWKIDCRLTAYSAKTQKILGILAGLCNQLEDSRPIGFLYLEAKGVLNKSFMKHLDYIYSTNPNTARSFIVIGSSNSAYTYEDPKEKKIHIKPVVSVATFLYWLENCLT